MKSILIPADFSTRSNNAIDFIVQLAKIISADVTILHVFELKGRAKIYKPLLDEVSVKLLDLKTSIEKKTGIVINTDIYEGALTESILQAAEDKNIDFIAMGTLGSHGIRGKLLGTATAAIIGNSDVPVIVIPFKYKWKQPEKILFVTKHFEEEYALFHFLFEFAELLSAEIHVAVFSGENKTDTIVEHARKITEYEEILKARYTKNKITAVHLSGAAFKEALLEYVNQNEIDVLTMVTYKRNSMDMIFNPSVTRAMSYYTKIPLLAIPGR